MKISPFCSRVVTNTSERIFITFERIFIKIKISNVVFFFWLEGERGEKRERREEREKKENQ